MFQFSTAYGSNKRPAPKGSLGRECTTLFIRPSRTCFSAVTVAFRPDLPVAEATLGPAAPGRVRVCCVAGFHRCAGSLRHSGRALLLPFVAFMCYVRFSISGGPVGCQRGEFDVGRARQPESKTLLLAPPLP